MTTNLCRQLLDRAAERLKGKQDQTYYLHDIARSRVVKLTLEKLLQLRWTAIPCPPYSPDLAATDYHLSHSLSNHLREKSFVNDRNAKIDLINSFRQKSKDCYEREILSLPEPWRRAVDSDSAYTTEN